MLSTIGEIGAQLHQSGVHETVLSLGVTELAFFLLFLAGALWLLYLILTMRVWLFLILLVIIAALV